MNPPITIYLCSRETLRMTDWLPIKAKELRFTGTKWWARWLWKLCVRLGFMFERPTEQIAYQSISISESDIVRLIEKNRLDLRYIWNREAKYLVLGHKDAHRLFGQIADASFNAFDVNVRLGFDNRRPEYRGLRMVIVPWIESGCFLLPSLTGE